MKQRKKLGRKLLSFLLTLAMIIGLMPGMAGTAQAVNGKYRVTVNVTSSTTDVGKSSTDLTKWPVDKITVTVNGQSKVINGSSGNVTFETDGAEPSNISFTLWYGGESSQSMTLTGNGSIASNQTVECTKTIQIGAWMTLKGHVYYSATKELLHSHTWEYTASDNVITATCSGDSCPVGTQTLTLSAPAGKTYDGNAVATPTVTKSSGWSTANGLEEPSSVTVSPTNSANVGTYTASVSVGSVTATSSWTISKADAVAPTLTAYTGNYDVDSHTITSSGGSGGNVKYSTDQSNWTTTLPTRTDVGTTIVYAKVFGDSNHNDSSVVSAEITINKANITPSVTIQGWNYGDSSNNPIVSGNTSDGNVSYEYKLKDADDTTYTDTIPNNAGNYTVKATIAQTDNYNSSEVTADFTIATRAITVTADNKSKIFGESDPQLTYSVSENGLVGSDALSNINLSRTDGDNVGTYAINVSQSTGSNPNYNITFVPGTFTIGKKSITPEVTLSQDTYTYNREQQTPTVYVRYNGTDMSTSDYEVLYSTDDNSYTSTIDSKDKGTYYIQVKAKASGNYTFDTFTKTYTINPKPMDASMVTLTDERYVYDGNEKQPVVSVQDGSIPLTDSEYKIDASSERSATTYGTYNIVINGIGNYTGSYTAVWSITKKAIEGVTINGVETTYDGEPHKLDVTIPGNATITYGAAAGEYTLPDNPEFKDAGVHAVYYKIEIDDNYEPIEGSETVVINPKAVTLTTTDKTMTYGEDDPTFDYTVEGLVGDDTLEGITFSREAGEDVGEYLISATNDTSKNTNYDITIVNTGKLTIQPKELTISDIVIDDQIYTGKELEPTVIIKDGDRIIPSTEYTVEYSDNIEPGKAKVTIKDVDGGNYIIKTIETTFNIIDPGIVEVIEPETPNANEADFAETPSEVISKIEFTDDDKEAQKNGKNIFVFLEVEDISETVPSADKKLVEDIIGTSLKELGIANDNSGNGSQSANAELKIGMYLDISLFKQVEGESKVKISETSGAIKIAFEIPADLRKDGRSYYIVKVHDGVASLITPTQSGNTLTFETDQFSTYALIYMDIKEDTSETTTTESATTATTTEAASTSDATTTASAKAAAEEQTAPKTGDSMPIAVLVVLMFAAAGMLVFMDLKKKKN